MTRSATALAILAALSFAPLAAQAQGQDLANGQSPGARGEERNATAGAPKADKKNDKDKGGAAPKIDAKAIERGKKEAPAVQEATGTPCQISNAAFRGEGSQKGPDGKPQKIVIYETACSGALGYLLLAPAGAKPAAYNCLTALGQATSCELPENADPKKSLSPLVTAAGKSCAISDAKYKGTSTKDGTTFYEVACAPQAGFLLSVPATGTPSATDCGALFDTPNACALTTKPQVIASLAPVVQASGKACTVSDVRWIGQGKATGDTFYELACGTAPGFVAIVDGTGKLKQAIDCSKADGIGDGCKMTDSTVAQTQEIGVYTKAAAKAGFPCQVSKYRFIGMDKQNREVVELACSDHPDGAVALFADGGKSEILDCVSVGGIGQSCKLTDPVLAYPKYTAALAAKGKSSCKVSGAAYAGGNTGGDVYVETACADGNPGWVVAYDPATKTAKEVLTCFQATNAGAPCKLPTNVAGNKKS